MAGDGLLGPHARIAFRFVVPGYAALAALFLFFVPWMMVYGNKAEAGSFPLYWSSIINPPRPGVFQVFADNGIHFERLPYETSIVIDTSRLLLTQFGILLLSIVAWCIVTAISARSRGRNQT